MPLRYNATELAILARKASSCFDKEGPLLMKDKQEGLFRKGEAYMQRLFRLRGNLLFYFKTKDPSSEILGVYVLERYMVQLDMEESKTYGFVVMFDNEKRPLELAASSEAERAGWIEMLHIASYECMKMQLQSLREQLRARTGRDPMEEQKESPTESNVSMPDNSGEPLIELALTCEKLPNDPSGKVPDTFVAVHYSTLQKQHWFPLGHTEVVQKSSNPSYLTTVGIFPQQQLLENDEGSSMRSSLKVKLVVYDVKERMTNTMAQSGSAIFNLDDLFKAPDDFLHLPLESVDSTDAGFITVELLSNLSEKESSAIKKLYILEQFYDKMEVKTYHFPSDFGRDLRVHEYLAASQLCFTLPVQLLTLWVEEEKHQIEQLQELGELGAGLEVTRKELLDYHMSTISTYMQNIRYLSTYQGAPFKPSAKKGHKEVEFAPTNLHLQRMWVQNVDRETNAFYDVTTVGAFTAYSLKYRSGGLQRLQSQLMEATGELTGAESQINPASVMNQLEVALVKVNELCEEMCRSALTGDPEELTHSLQKLEIHTKGLIEHCSNPLVEDGVLKHSETRMCSTSASPQAASPPKGSWKWSGTDFVKSPTEEPWELTRLNTEAALVCVLSMVDSLLKDQSSASQWLEKLSPLMIRLKSCIQVMCQRAKSGLMFLSVKLSPGQVPLLHTIKYRHDICFSQALTAAVSAVENVIHCNISDTHFMKQIQEIGLLLEFEGLLSCYTSEMGMIEDMVVAVLALKSVSFRLIQTVNGEHPKPVVESNNQILTSHYPDMSRCGYVVTLALPEEMFEQLPAELRLGKLIKTTPVFFNIGINEQATLAEKIGDLTVQEELNLENYKLMLDYHTAFIEFSGRENAEIPGDLEQLMRILQVEAVKKKQKNVDLLHTAAAVCRLLSGLRFTSCKSAKDRTAMSVTLELTQILLHSHGLNKTLYVHVLDCMRSQGLRRENTKKNTGSRKYAFNSLQLLSIPKLYRPPSGTYGNTQT